MAHRGICQQFQAWVQMPIREPETISKIEILRWKHDSVDTNFAFSIAKVLN
jgi:hypothetical protein